MLYMKHFLRSLLLSLSICSAALAQGNTAYDPTQDWFRYLKASMQILDAKVNGVDYTQLYINQKEHLIFYRVADQLYLAKVCGSCQQRTGLYGTVERTDTQQGTDQYGNNLSSTFRWGVRNSLAPEKPEQQATVTITSHLTERWMEVHLLYADGTEQSFSVLPGQTQAFERIVGFVPVPEPYLHAHVKRGPDGLLPEGLFHYASVTEGEKVRTPAYKEREELLLFSQRPDGALELSSIEAATSPVKPLRYGVLKRVGRREFPATGNIDAQTLHSFLWFCKDAQSGEEQTLRLNIHRIEGKKGPQYALRIYQKDVLTFLGDLQPEIAGLIE